MSRARHLAIAFAIVACTVFPNAIQSAKAAVPVILSSFVTTTATTAALTINGSNLTPGSASIFFGSLGPLVVTTQTSTQIIATLPTGLPAGDYTVSVQIGTKNGNSDETVTTIGAIGPIGPQGPTGVAGPAGPAGAQGSQGLTGLTGPAGAIGPAGAQGATGPTGNIGAQGPTGATGSPGPQGLTGPTGPPGMKGDAGVKGDTGSGGLQGPQGPPGPVGAGAIRVLDSNNVQVGLLVNSASGPSSLQVAFYDATGNRYIALTVSVSGIQTSTADPRTYYFASSDCSGPRLVRANATPNQSLFWQVATSVYAGTQSIYLPPDTNVATVSVVSQIVDNQCKLVGKPLVDTFSTDDYTAVPVGSFAPPFHIGQ